MGLCKQLEEYAYGCTYVQDIYEKLSKRNKIYIFGAGDRAQWLGKIFLRNEIHFQGFLVNRKYYKDTMKSGMYGYEKPILCYEDVVSEEKELTIVLGIAQSLLDLSMFKVDSILEVIPINIGNREDYLFSYKTIMDHQNELDELYDMLEDEYSKDYLFYCLRGRLTGRDYDFMPSSWSDPQYFLEDFIEWEKKECIVDCGAFDGDTVAEFLKKKPKSEDFEYKVYAWEPDAKSFGILDNLYQDNPAIVTIPKATYSEKGRFGFSADGGEMSAIMLNEENMIDTDTIDSVLGEDKVTFIKMDVEGSELHALIGAQNQIKENKPRLAICIYHK